MLAENGLVLSRTCKGPADLILPMARVLILSYPYCRGTSRDGRSQETYQLRISSAQQRPRPGESVEVVEATCKPRELTTQYASCTIGWQKRPLTPDRVPERNRFRNRTEIFVAA